MNCGESLKKKGHSANYAERPLEMRQMQATLDLQPRTPTSKIDKICHKCGKRNRATINTKVGNRGRSSRTVIMQRPSYMPVHALHAEARERNRQMGRPKQEKASDTFQKGSTRLTEDIKGVQFTFDVESGKWIPAEGWEISYGYLVRSEEE